MNMVDVDIPDPLYRELKSRAAAEGGTVKQLLLRGAERVLREPTKKKLPRLKEPPLNKGIPGFYSERNTRSPKEWGDSYLIAFAAATSMPLVTFDAELSQRYARAILLAG
jgi:hypothetical protein